MSVYISDLFTGTIGLSMSPSSIPGSGPSFQLQHDEMELGLGDVLFLILH